MFQKKESRGKSWNMLRSRKKTNIYDISALMLIPWGLGGHFIDLVLLSPRLHSKNGSMERPTKLSSRWCFYWKWNWKWSRLKRFHTIPLASTFPCWMLRVPTRPGLLIFGSSPRRRSGGICGRAMVRCWLQDPYSSTRLLMLGVKASLFWNMSSSKKCLSHARENYQVSSGVKYGLIESSTLVPAYTAQIHSIPLVNFPIEYHRMAILWVCRKNISHFQIFKPQETLRELGTSSFSPTNFSSVGHCRLSLQWTKILISRSSDVFWSTNNMICKTLQGLELPWTSRKKGTSTNCQATMIK